jgi:hypothetical protein
MVIAMDDAAALEFTKALRQYLREIIGASEESVEFLLDGFDLYLSKTPNERIVMSAFIGGVHNEPPPLVEFH